MVQYNGDLVVLLRVDHLTMVLEVSKRARQTLTFERVRYSKFKHESQPNSSIG